MQSYEEWKDSLIIITLYVAITARPAGSEAGGVIAVWGSTRSALGGTKAMRVYAAPVDQQGILS